jgi:hypothetical protein
MADLPNDADLVTDMSTHVQPIGMRLLASKNQLCRENNQPYLAV